MTNEQYHQHPAISKSGLDLINQAPAKYWEKYKNPNRKKKQKTTDTFLTGSAFHTFVLEPETLERDYIVMPNFTGTGSKAKKESFYEKNFDKTVISLSVHETVSRMRDSVFKHPFYKEFMQSGGKAEESYFFTNPETGVKCKIRPDYHDEYCVDLKSTDDASERGFQRSVYKYRYDVQGAFYTDGLNEVGIYPNGFIFFAVEKEPPYLCNVFYLSNNLHDIGRMKYLEDLETYKNCLQLDEWPGYGDEIKLLNYKDEW